MAGTSMSWGLPCFTISSMILCTMANCSAVTVSFPMPGLTTTCRGSFGPVGNEVRSAPPRSCNRQPVSFIIQHTCEALGPSTAV